ncbi:hypothetical protein ACHAXS_001280, partial [Conticribra weissflogii]
VLECFVDVDFAVGWATGHQTNPEFVLLQTGFVIMYAGCPIYWKSKLQTKIALSKTDDKYVPLFHFMREVLPFLTLLKEIHDVFPLKNQSQNATAGSGRKIAFVLKLRKVLSS